LYCVGDPLRIFITVLLSEQWFTENNSLSILLTVQLFCLPRLSYVETKTDDVDEIDLPGFIIKRKNRFQFRRVKSGGIIVGFRKSLGDNISIIETDMRKLI
jgi:hypothetical protein